MNFLKMYENQAEKMRKELSALQADNQQLADKVHTLEAENFAIANGKLQVTDSTYFQKGDGRLNLKIRDLEEQNYQLQENLTQNQQDFRDLLSELTAIKQQINQRDEQIRHMESEMKLRPTLALMNAKKVQIEQLTKKVAELEVINNDLHNEAMQRRNEDGSHLQSRSILENIGGKGDSRMVVNEICSILSVPGEDPVILLETIRKLEKVVKAVPRMEGFIHNLS